MLSLCAKRQIYQAKKEDSTYAKIDKKWSTFRGGAPIYFLLNGLGTPTLSPNLGGGDSMPKVWEGHLSTLFSGGGPIYPQAPLPSW